MEHHCPLILRMGPWKTMEQTILMENPQMGIQNM